MPTSTIPTEVEVFADITCPFTHVGLKQVVAHIARMSEPVDVVVRAWPLEWVNGTPMAVAPVIEKARALSEQLGVDDFDGLRADRWPTTTLPALDLVARAYERDAGTGLAVSLELRSALFEHGVDVADPDALALIAAAHHLGPPSAESGDSVRRDYETGRERGVQGSPHFFVGVEGFFCPTLDLDHDATGHLLARFDEEAFADFLACIER